MCLECQPQYPFYWMQEFSCFAGQCPDGSYEIRPERCSTCEHPCKYCTAAKNCTLCDARSPLPVLFEQDCLAECVPGYTPIDNICVKCSTPCATCAYGQINSCTSCDNTDGLQFLYSKKCVEECPTNTTLNYNTKVCLGCDVGCSMCDTEDPRICLKCSPGLSLLNNICMQECPFDYLKSPDGSTCERRTYPLDRTFVAFPFLGVALFVGLISMASYWLTG